MTAKKNNVRIRPDINHFRQLPSGLYPGVIIEVSFKEELDKYNNDRPHEVIHIKAALETDGGAVNLIKRVAYVKSWSDKSNMYKLLDDLGCLPGLNEEFDFDSLIGMNVTVVVKNNTVGDRTYSNIDKMLPRSTKKSSTTTIGTAASTKKLADIKQELLNDDADEEFDTSEYFD